MSESSHVPQLVAVTGGAGFIGSHTVGRLLDAGHRVVVLDNFSSGKKENLASWTKNLRLHTIETNIDDGVFAALSGITKKHGPIDRIIHLAAQTAVVSSIQNPLEDIRRNYAATVHVLEFARHTGVRKVVFASSAAVYGDLDTLPVGEDVRCAPVSPYGIDKLGSEHYMAYYSTVHGVATTALRFFNVYGPRQDPRSSYSGAISIFFDRALRNEDILIFGDGQQTRDFVYVGDVASAITAAVMNDAATATPINIGTGTEVTIDSVANLIVASVGSSSTIRHVEARPGEILRSRAKIDVATKLLGFTATTPISDGLATTGQWYRQAVQQKR